MGIKFQMKRGAKAALPTLAPGELAMTTDEKTLYYGTGGENIPLAREAHKHQAADLPDAMPPSGHRDSHKTGGTDALTAADVGAAAEIHTHDPASVGLSYGVCSSSGSSRTVSVPEFQLIAGARIAVTFSYDVGSSLTLNVSGTGARYIQWQGINLFGGIIGAGDTAELVYTGSYWYLLAVDKVAGSLITFADASWATIGAIAQAGLAQNFWLKGDKKNLTLTTGEIITMRIEDFNHDTLTSGGKAPLSLIMENGPKTKHNMNGSNTNVGGWGSSEMRSWMSNTLFGQLPSDLQAVIKSVNKLTSAGNNSPSIVTSSDKLWLPSYTEAGFAHNPSFSPGGEGSAYPLFISDASRIKTVDGFANGWWLRSPYAASTVDFGIVSSSGGCNNGNASYAAAAPFGFCI